MQSYYVYMLTNAYHNVLYIGVTNDVQRRMYEHKMKLVRGFTQKYNADTLVYLEETPDITAAITREKQLKGWTRQKKNELIATLNPAWDDLSACHPERSEGSPAMDGDPSTSLRSAQDDKVGLRSAEDDKAVAVQNDKMERV